MASVVQAGSGGYGKVYFKEENGQKVAVKEFHESKKAFQGIQSDLIFAKSANRQEIDLLLRIDHPHILKAHKMNLNFTPPIKVELIMEAGETDLNNLIKKGPIQVSDRLEYAKGVICGLEFLHRHGLLHCDVKSDNVIIVGGVAKLADPGLYVDRRSIVGNIYETIISDMIKCNPIVSNAPEVLSGIQLPIRQAMQGGITKEWYETYVKKYGFQRNFTYEAYRKAEFFSLSIVLYELYTNKVHENPRYLWYAFKFSMLSFDDRVKAINNAIPEMDSLCQLICALADADTNTRLTSFEGVKEYIRVEKYPEGVFRHNPFVRYVPKSVKDDELFNEVLEGIRSFAIMSKLNAYQASQVMALYHYISEMYKNTMGIDTIVRHGRNAVVSLFLSLTRTNIKDFHTSNDAIYTFFRQREMIDANPVAGLALVTFGKLKGMFSFKTVVDYASCGEVAYFGLNYYHLNGKDKESELKEDEYIVLLEAKTPNRAYSVNDSISEIKRRY